ncbi:hypothetical protein C8034_v004271 [Colletotrichum sidae]|uniref:DUF6594 domain-containing protein n=1 Tax=Colletotrichum sidae TaxID=1347389 RepID=A0A4R8TMB1_9PEZI|nr:hypothetical protein C8034_v004271 [Colletotrichum sidae]
MGYQPRGYARLANLMAKEKDVAIFRRFDNLNLLSLLSLQAEIVQLEVELRIAMRADEDFGGSSTASPQVSGHHVDTSVYSGNFRLSRQADSRQYQILDKIRGKLKDYCFLLRAYHHIIGHRVGTGEIVDEVSEHASYSRDPIRKISNFSTTILACIMPVLTIFVLNPLSSTNGRIFVTLAFTALFATLLAIFSKAKKVEIFAATATFAAVEVVFIGSAIER